MQATALSTTSRIPLGTPVIYYNKWTGFETDRFRGQFTALSGKQVSELSPGTVVYKDVDPLHMHGKVYGRVKGQIVSVVPKDGALWVEYDFGTFGRGGTRIELDAESTVFEIANDEDVLARLLDEMPDAKVIDRRH